jgi:hypothetical protein
MITRLIVSCEIWYSKPGYWLAKFDYTAIKEDFQLNFVFIDTEEEIEADLNNRFAQ